MQRILVTGAGGFLGRHAVEELSADCWDVIGSGRIAPALDGLSDSLAADILAPGSARLLVEAAKADTLLHLAWYDDPKRRWHAPENLDWVAATLSLARAFADTGGKRIVFASSCAVYDTAARSRHKETDPIGPSSLYGAAKAATGSLLAQAAPALAITFAEARMFYCYGPGEPAGRLLPELISGLRQGKSVDCTDGRQKRDYMHAKDIGRALAMICASDISGPVNVASGASTPVANLVEEVARQMGRPELPSLGALARAETDPSEIVAEVSRLTDLEFTPKFDIPSGVAQTLRSEMRDPGA